MRRPPFLLEVFSEIPEKPRERERVYTVSIPLRRFSRASSQQYASYPARVYRLKKMCSDGEGRKR